MTITVTLIIIGITVLISWQAFNNYDIFSKFMHYPYEEHRDKEYYRWVTSVFLHGSWMHLAINMFVLYNFGSYIEGTFGQFFGDFLGKLNFLLLYILSGVFADVPTYFKHKNNQMFSSVGASGATSGIMFAFVLIKPWDKIYLFGIEQLGLSAIWAAIIYLFYSSYASRRGGDRIDHEAHFWGAVFGFVFTIALKPELFTTFIDQVLNGLPF